MGYPHYSNDCCEHWPTVTICGSMRFFPQMLEVAAELTRRGRIVLMPFCVVAPEDLDSALKERLDLLHRKKIDLASEVLVVSDESGYCGESTKAEIDYALQHHKRVDHWNVVTRPTTIEAES